MSPYNSTFSKPGKPLARKSAKRVIEDRELENVKREVLARDGRLCQFPTPASMVHPAGGCVGSPVDVHHVVTVARDKTLRLEPTNLITLCRRHHSWVHDNVAEATELGLLASSPRNTQEAGL